MQNHMDKQQILAAARQALMAADSQYFAWTALEQERFRASMGDDARRKIQCVLLNSLLGIKCTTENVDDIWSDVPIAKLNPLNWAKLLTTGIGEDYIYLNESMSKGESLLDYPTLFDYDYADYLFQEKARKRDFSEYKSHGYYAYQYQTWVRLLIKERFHYSTFTSLATYVMSEIESAGNDVIDRLIPHEYVEGKNHGQRKDGGFLWDFRVDAAGLEAQLDELKSRWYAAYQQERWLALSQVNKSLPPAVYTQEKNWDDDPQMFFIFTNEATLKQLRWTHFLSDCEPLMVDYAVVEMQLTEEVAKATAWLTDNHADILENFDPTVVKLKKTRNIIMSEKALEDINKINEEDEPPL